MRWEKEGRAGPERGALGNKLAAAPLPNTSGRKTSVRASRRSWCLLSSSPWAFRTCGQVLGVVNGPARGRDPPECHQASTASPADAIRSAVHLVHKQSQTLLSHPHLPGASWDFHNRSKQAFVISPVNYLFYHN